MLRARPKSSPRVYIAKCWSRVDRFVISSASLSLTIFAYICVVLRLRWPSIFDTDSIGTPFVSVTVVANVWRARWKVSRFSMPQKVVTFFEDCRSWSHTSLFVWDWNCRARRIASNFTRFYRIAKVEALWSEKNFLTLYISKHKYYERSRLCIYPYQSKFQGGLG